MMTLQRKLELSFLKSIRKGYTRNAQVNPQPPKGVTDTLLPEERCIVVVDNKQGRRLWLTDRRVLMQGGSAVIFLFDYRAVHKVHWMFKDAWKRALNGENMVEMKSAHFDRLEVELTQSGSDLVVLEGLDQAYAPMHAFLIWLQIAQEAGSATT